MYFCPNCNYSFDITKSDSTNSKKVLSSIEDILNLIKSNDDLSNYSTTLEKKIMLLKIVKYLKY